MVVHFSDLPFSVSILDMPDSASIPDSGIALSTVSLHPVHSNARDNVVPMMETPPSSAAMNTGGFGVVNCVICGGKDHATYMCRQRDKRFIHM